MELITTLGIWSLESVSSYTVGLLPGFISGLTSNNIGAVASTVVTELGPRLSQNAAILLPGSVQFADATDLWQQYMVPNITVVVDVASESDVQQTVSQVDLSISR